MKHDTNHPMGHAGHDHHAMMIHDFKKRFYVVLALTIPVMLLSSMIQHWLHIKIAFAGSNYALLLLSSIVFFYGGWPFLTGWLEEMKAWKPGMMTLIGFAITVAYVYSVATVTGLARDGFFLGTGYPYPGYVTGPLDRNEVRCGRFAGTGVIGTANAFGSPYYT
ncbi:hypothetical protein ACQ86N_22730 [Puia sp. P3]|uniref:hypothetical protein n=1 Tax=Puia sp. P3 TaxID=3423952 RepID=UPI003D664B2F